MMTKILPRAAVVDFSVGHLQSVCSACEDAGMSAAITCNPNDIASADLVVLSGVGTFGDAMANLKALHMIGPLKEYIASNRPLLGINLGLHVLFSECMEFGRHKGLDVFRGEVRRFADRSDEDGFSRRLNHTGFTGILRNTKWEASPLAGLCDGESMYFDHSLYAKPENADSVLGFSLFSGTDFCSAVNMGNIFAVQFHPELSGPRARGIFRIMASAASSSVN
jgi:glutamine amidotransferase